MKKTLQFTFKKTENDKKTDIQNVKKSQNQTWNVRYRHLHINN